MKKTFILTGILLCATVLLSFSQQSPGKGKFINFTEGGVLVGNSQDENKAPFIFHSSLNYAFSRNLSAGLGVGAEFLKETYLPVTVNALCQFKKEKEKAIYPFIRLQAGYQVGLESKMATYSNYPYHLSSSYLYMSSYYPYYSWEKLSARGGWLINPSAGVIIYSRSGLGITLTAGYRHQILNYTGKEDYKIIVEYNRLSITLGIIF